MSFLGVKVILFWVIPLIIKEKSNASALRSMRDDFINDFLLVLTLFIYWPKPICGFRCNE